MADRDTLIRILELARWAPSGDNTQPWRFEILADDHIAVHGFDTRDDVVYDFDGHASQMAHGALLETLRIAATRYGFATEWSLRTGCSDNAPIYDVLLRGGVADPHWLLPFIETRVVQRRPMRMTPLTGVQREALRAAPGLDFQIQFYESYRERRRIARLLWDGAHIRLTCPEAYSVHRNIIDWGVRFSHDRIPELAVGVDVFTSKLMKWVMQNWNRVDFFNRYLLGTVLPRIELDLLPSICCAAHVLLRSQVPLKQPIDYVRAGEALQRLWLTATSVGLHLQPEMTPVIFRWYARAGRSISSREGLDREVALLAERFDAALGLQEGGECDAFMCRVGVSSRPQSRSLRKDINELLC